MPVSRGFLFGWVLPEVFVYSSENKWFKDDLIVYCLLGVL